MAGRERMRLTDRAVARFRPREREYTVWDNHVAGLGVPGPAHRRAELCPAGGCRRALAAGLSWPGVPEDRRRGPPGKPCAQGGTGSDRRAQARGSAVPGLRRGCVEGCPFRGIQAVHEKGRPVRARPPARAGLRLEAARPHHAGAHRAMVRPVQPDRPGNANHALDLLTQIVNFAIERGHLDNQPGAGGGTEPETGAHALPVPGGDRPAASGPGQADPPEQV